MMKAAIALSGLLAITAHAADEPPSLIGLLDRAGRYVRTFQSDFETVISDETYVQRERQSRFDRASNATRTISSEALFMWVTEDRSWLMVRNVLKVDGRSVPDSRARLEGALRDSAPRTATATAQASGVEPLASRPLVSRFRQLRDESARFNLGHIFRNVNDPMLPFQFVDPSYQPRFSFAIAGPDTIDGVAVWKLTFAEIETPSMPTVVTVDRHTSPATGEICSHRAASSCGSTSH